jgi:hypothetical protein
MKQLFLYPYSSKSQSAKLLADTLPCKRIKHNNSRYQPSERNLLINWGASRINVPNTHFPILNAPQYVRNSSNKLSTYQILKDNNIKTCEWTQDINIAQQWVNHLNVVFGRDKLNGHGGNDITLYDYNTNPTVGQHLFYTTGIHAIAEFRVHVLKSAEDYFTYHTQEKRKIDNWDYNYGHLPANHIIKNHSNGYVFVINNLTISETNKTELINLATKALLALNLDFGAFDIIQSINSFVVLECNTAPGLKGTTLNVYTNYFRQRAALYN